MSQSDYRNQEIAIVGMACRFPGAANLDEFWELLRRGDEAVILVSEDELRAAGVDPVLLSDPNYVRARGVLAGVDLFDAELFGFSAREAELTDPQHRLFLECAWTALEDAGLAPDSHQNTVGVFAGSGWNSYLLLNLASHRGLFESDAAHQTLLGNEKDNLTTRVSYKLNLTGPSVAVQTGCSSSLTATSLACQSLLAYQCDVALAGGVSISIPQTGYLYRPGGIFSPDGHCRAFDAKAGGTVIGSGVGVVVLKRLEDALVDRDHIYAVIKGTAINNDGATKIGYTAPSVEGQARVIVEAHAMAGVPTETITYVEAHGTGTAVGDPIEMAALTKAFRDGTSKKNFCALGSVKTNIGHLDAAAGVAGLIKVALALEHRQLPESLHFEEPNPEIDFSGGPFFVNTRLSSWESPEAPRRAGVSSFGLGGTNVHLVLEEAPATSPRAIERSPQLLLLSARTSRALERATTNLAVHLRRPGSSLADIAYTLQVGRKAFAHRRVLVCDRADEAALLLERREPGRVSSFVAGKGDCPIAFLFPGQGSQHVDMARELYETEPAFREHAERCFDFLATRHGLDLRRVLYPADSEREEAALALTRTENAQPALFAVEYALARMWSSWGVGMRAAIGHSIGEYVAAALAGVFSVEDALSLVTLRGQLMQRLPPGAMLAVALPESDVRSLIGPGLSLAAVNYSSSCVVSGDVDAIAALEQKLPGQHVACRRLRTSHAFHSHMMDPVLPSFAQAMARVRLQPPRIPYLSNVTGTWITDAQATDVSYWVRHLREPVRFSDGLRALGDHLLLEVGPARNLGQFATRQERRVPGLRVLSTLPHPSDVVSDRAFLSASLGQLWLSGIGVDWAEVSRHRQRDRVRVPTYPFDHQRYWIEPSSSSEAPRSSPNGDDAWGAFIEAAANEAKSVVSFDQRSYITSRGRLEKTCIAYIHAAVQHLSGGPFRATTKHAVEALMRRCRIVPRYHQLFSRMLCVASEDAHMRSDGVTEIPPWSMDDAEAFARAAQRDGAIAPEVVELAQACGRALPAVLVGEQDPLDLFTSLLERGTGRSHSGPLLDAHYNRILRLGLEGVLKRLPSTTALRVLEIGGGTGIATRELLPMLPADRTRYKFSDVAKLFVSRAKQEFSGYPFVDYGLLDIEKSPAEQGYTEQSFDVIIAVNVLHATRILAETLEHVRSLLAPGGLLLLWEITRPSPDFDVTYGLLMNPLEDGRRTQGNPFLSGTEWLAALAAHGFERSAVLPENDLFGQQLVVAQRSPTTSEGSKTKPAFESAVRTDGVGSLPLFAKRHDIADWFYVPSWKRSTPPRPAAARTLARWVLFVDRCGLGEALAQRMAHRKLDVFTVGIGNELRPGINRGFSVDPQASDCDSLFEALRSRGDAPINVVDLRGVTTDVAVLTPGTAFPEFHALLALTKAIGDQRPGDVQSLTMVCNQLHDVTGEETISPEKALLLAPCRVLPLEHPHVACRSVDVVWTKGAAERITDRLLDELLGNFDDRAVALRGGYRWVPAVAPFRLERSSEPSSRLTKNGVYLITGGLGNIGLTVAEYLARTVAAKLVLSCRSSFPPPEAWDEWVLTHPGCDRCSRLIRRLRVLGALGSEVHVVSADVANLDEMKVAIARAEKRFGAICGVIHSAGVLGDGTIQCKTSGAVDDVLRPKVHGTIVLDTLFEGRPLDFFVLFSSLSAVKPGFGQVAYSAANNFLDAFGKTGRRPTICISWDVWQGDGMAYDATMPLALQRLKENDFSRRGLLPHEGAEVFSRILASALPHVLVCTSDYLHSSDHDLPRLYLEELNNTNLSATNHARPALATAYLAPESETEETLTRIWEELLGIAPIGVEDDFFELGGDSLIGTQLATRAKARLGVKLPAKTVYLRRTIRSMSAAIEETLVSQTSAENLAEILKKLDGLE